MKIADRAMTRLLEERAKAGVEVRIIGKVTRKTNGLAVRKLNGMRLHTRTIIRDRSQMFIGSQSLRELELDARREIGIILPDRKIIASVIKVFETDWDSRQPPRRNLQLNQPRTPWPRLPKKSPRVLPRTFRPWDPWSRES